MMFAHRYAILALSVALPVFLVAGLGMALLVEVAIFLISLGAHE